MYVYVYAMRVCVHLWVGIGVAFIFFSPQSANHIPSHKFPQSKSFPLSAEIFKRS